MREVVDMSVVVTGGGSGLGEATARRLVRLGASVTICGRRAERVADVARDIGPRCAWVDADVGRDDDRRRLVEAVLAHAGGIDGMVHAAGNMYRGPLDQLEQDRLEDIFRTNVIGSMMLTGMALPHLESRQGAVVFFGSVHVTRAFPGASPYAATKGALEALTAALAAELGPRGVRVGCVRPGAVLTELNQRAGLFSDEVARQRIEALGPAHALGRPGTPEEVAEGVEYLLRAEWTTGAVLVVDGGLGLGTTNA